MSGPERIAPAYHPESARSSWLCNPKRRVAGFSESQNTHSSKVGVSGAPEDLFSVAGCQLAISRVGMENSLSEHPYGKKTHLRFQGRGVYPTEGSCRFPLIVLQQTTQSFLATHNSVIPARPSIRQWEQEPVLLALVIALLVVMGHILLQGSAQRPLPEQDE